MNWFETCLHFLKKTMIEPPVFGWFHIMFLILTIIIAVFICLKYRDSDPKKIVLFFSLLSISLEIYKQLMFSFSYENEIVKWSYQWYAFPFQFCSVPMYIGLLSVFFKNKRFVNALYAFLASYGLIAGIATMLYPETMFIDTIGINIQTMIHHGSMIIVGSYLLTNRSIKFDKRTIFGASLVFISCVLIALSIDITTYYVGLDGGMKMFFISPFYQSSLPVLSSIYLHVHYLVFLLIYLLIFIVPATTILVFLKNKNGVSGTQKNNSLI